MKALKAKRKKGTRFKPDATPSTTIFKKGSSQVCWGRGEEGSDNRGGALQEMIGRRSISILYPDNGVCLSVCVCVTEVMSLPIWGPISACIVSATVTLPHFRVIASAFNEY